MICNFIEMSKMDPPVNTWVWVTDGKRVLKARWITNNYGHHWEMDGRISVVAWANLAMYTQLYKDN